MSMPPNSPQQSPYGNPGFVPPPPQKKRNPVLVGCLGCGGLLVALILLVAIVSAVSGDKSPTTATPPVIPSSGSAVPSSRSAGPAKTTPAQPSSAPKPHTVLTEDGNGIKTTRTFHVRGDWDLYYSFNCANFGGQGNFAVADDSTGEAFVNALAANGKDVTHQHNGGGAMALNITSECNWRIKVVELP